MSIHRRKFLKLASGTTTAMAVPAIPALLLNGLSSSARAWQTGAIAFLEKIHENRNAGSPGKSACCIFEFGDAYVQFLAPPNLLILCVEATSERFLEEDTLTTIKKRLLRRLGFNPPGGSRKPNYWQEIPIRRYGDLTRAARLAYYVLEQVYKVKDFAATRSWLSLPEDQTFVFRA